MRPWWLLALAFCLIPRALDLVCDPPPTLGESGGYYADEGFWTHNARNKVLFGTWVTDEWNNMYASPLTHGPTFVSFRLFGVGLRQARIIPVALSLIAVLLIIWGLPGHAAPLGALLFSSNVLLIHFGRLSLLEAPLILLLLASWALLAQEKLTWRELFLSGIAMGLAVGTKLSVAYFIPAAFLTVILRPGAMGRGKGLLFLASGFVLAAALWIVMVGSHLGSFLQYVTYYSSQQAPWATRLLHNIRHPVLFSRLKITPLVLTGGFIVAAGMVRETWKSTVPRSILLATLWFVFGALYLNTLTYAPLRYHLPLLPALVILASWFGVEAWQGNRRLRLSLPGALFILLFLGPTVWQFVCDLRPGLSWWSTWRKLFLAILAIGGLYVIWEASARIFRCRRLRRIFLGTALIACLGLHAYQYLHWFGGRTHEIYSTSKALGERFHTVTFTGQWAPVLCLENRHRAVPVWPGFINGEEPFERYAITHGLIWGRHWKRFNEWFPEEFGNAAVLDTLWIKESPVVLCQFGASWGG